MTRLMPTHVVFGLLIGIATLTPAKGDDQLQDRCDRIAKEVERLVGIELKKQVAVQRISRDEYRKSMRSQVEAQLIKKRIDGWIRSLQLLGLFDDRFDFEELLDHVATAANANYSPATKMIQIIPGSESSETDETVFHELVHAAQDQRHDLNRIFEQLDTLGSTDAMMAFRVLLEGEAVFWPMLFTRQMTLERRSGFRMRDKAKSSATTGYLLPRRSFVISRIMRSETPGSTRSPWQ
jgi:hypothetical protein